MDSVAHENEQMQTTKSKPQTKCSWCDRKRARNDLCNVCRQKVESRSRRLMEQKLEGDMDVVQKVMKFFKRIIPLNKLTNHQTLNLVFDCYPFMMLRYQSENTYRGKKGNRCWCLPESVLKKMVAKCYNKNDSDVEAALVSGGRQQLCALLMSSVVTTFGNYGIHIQPTQIETDDATEGAVDYAGEDGGANSNTPKKALKRATMDESEEQLDWNTPPMKRARSFVSPASDPQIWGRSDTQLLSFDMNKLDSFLRRFESDVLNGTEWQTIEASQRVDFLKVRCKEFAKMLTEFKGYVLHLRQSVTQLKQENCDGNQVALALKNDEIARLKQALEQTKTVVSDTEMSSEKLFRCVTDLLTRLSPKQVDVTALRSSMHELERYHQIACSELSDAVRCFESIGGKLGNSRSADQSLNDFATQLHTLVAQHSLNSSTLSALYVQKQNGAPHASANSNTSRSTPTSSLALSSSVQSGHSDPFHAMNAPCNPAVYNMSGMPAMPMPHLSNGCSNMVSATGNEESKDAYSSTTANLGAFRQLSNPSSMSNNLALPSQNRSSLVLPIANPYGANFMIQSTNGPLDAHALRNLGIVIPTVTCTSISSGQHLATRR